MVPPSSSHPRKDRIQKESHQAPNVSLVSTLYSSPLPSSIPLNQYNIITEVTITTGPLADIGSTFEATAHLIPQIDVGISALNGIASTDVFLNLDASADFTASTTSIANPQPCVTVSSNINVGVGAEGSFFSLFNKTVSKSLFDKTFPLFQVRSQGLPYTIFVL